MLCLVSQGPNGDNKEADKAEEAEPAYGASTGFTSGSYGSSSNAPAPIIEAELGEDTTTSSRKVNVKEGKCQHKTAFAEGYQAAIIKMQKKQKATTNVEGEHPMGSSLPSPPPAPRATGKDMMHHCKVKPGGGHIKCDTNPGTIHDILNGMVNVASKLQGGVSSCQTCRHNWRRCKEKGKFFKRPDGCRGVLDGMLNSPDRTFTYPWREILNYNRNLWLKVKFRQTFPIEYMLVALSEKCLSGLKLTWENAARFTHEVEAPCAPIILFSTRFPTDDGGALTMKTKEVTIFPKASGRGAPAIYELEFYTPAKSPHIVPACPWNPLNLKSRDPECNDGWNVYRANGRRIEPSTFQLMDASLASFEPAAAAASTGPMSSMLFRLSKANVGLNFSDGACRDWLQKKEICRKKQTGKVKRKHSIACLD